MSTSAPETNATLRIVVELAVLGWVTWYLVSHVNVGVAPQWLLLACAVAITGLALAGHRWTDMLLPAQPKVTEAQRWLTRGFCGVLLVISARTSNATGLVIGAGITGVMIAALIGAEIGKLQSRGETSRERA